MKQRRKPGNRIRVNANTSLPEDLTDQFREKILSLTSSPKSDYLKREIFSKFVSDKTDPSSVRRQRAINKWLATERENEATNDRILLYSEEYNILPRVGYGRFVEFSRKIIRDLIGETIPTEALIGSFSGGASTSRARTESHPASKYLGKAHITYAAEKWFDLLMEEVPLLACDPEAIPELGFVRGNVLFTVPKKTDIDRVACKEPDINMFMQKGVGDYFRKSLRRVGINLNDQSKNRSLARIGSIDNKLATLDLSSASDSVTTGVVSLLLPECWHSLLDDLRSPVTIIDGEEHRNQMFSSMGNGFTFELESLLFYTLVRATCYFRGVPGVVSVYGDDIICPSEAVPYVTHVLEFFGFSLNREKSFDNGPFRESCGGHYWNGYDITPFYVKAPISTLVDAIHVANSLRKWGTIPELGVLDPEVESIWLWLKSFVPNTLWGGWDYSFKFQLVSHDVSHSRLVSEKKSAETGLGGYFHWHNATWDRDVTRDAVCTSKRSHEKAIYRQRPYGRHTVPSLPALFLHEIALM